MLNTAVTISKTKGNAARCLVRKANRAAHELQAKREALEKQQRELIEREAPVTKCLGQLVGEDGYTLFAEGLVQPGARS